jgi:hypothetical protein
MSWASFRVGIIAAIWLGVVVMFCANITAVDPEPRFELLGRTNIAGNSDLASVYIDHATHQEIVCFNRFDYGNVNAMAMTCWLSGRTR